MFFLIYLILGFTIYIQTREPNDYSNLNNVIYLETSFLINEENFNKLPRNSCVVLDDFAFVHTNKKTKNDFLKVINFNLRHHNITLFLVIHNLYNNNLSNEILLAPHIFLSYSNLGFNIIR
jgi:hypothetical protein